MSHIADTFNGLGYLPLQHKGCIDQGWTVATMDSVLCVRTLGRERTGDNAGAYSEDPDARGNLGGAICWQVPRSSPRKIGMWNFAFASVVVGGGKSTSSGSAITLSGGSSTGSDDYACLPVRDEFDSPDTRFSTIIARLPAPIRIRFRGWDTVDFSRAVVTNSRWIGFGTAVPAGTDTNAPSSMQAVLSATNAWSWHAA